MAEEVGYHLDRLAANDIPITVYHFDGASWDDGTGTCTWALGDALIMRLQASGIRALLHFWGGCNDVQDFERAYAQLGSTLAGFYLDEGSTDMIAKNAIDWLQSKLPGDGEVVMKSNRADGYDDPPNTGIATYGHTCYVNDMTTDFQGLRDGIALMLNLATTLPAPFSEFTAFNWGPGADEETYFRRIHFGALQVVMDHSPLVHVSPWEAQYSADLLADYKYFAWLHYELAPYLHSYDWQAYEAREPILRAPDPVRFTTKLGDEIFVAYVTEPGTEQEKQQRGTTQPWAITLPPGEWIDYWDASQTYTGNITRPVPWGKEPIFIRPGAIIPMQVSRPYTGHGTNASEGSLTVLVYPNGKSRFRYRDDDKDRWIDIGSELTGGTLTLGVSEFPSQPLLYRVERWSSPPTAVRVCGTTVMVNGPAELPESPSEDAANGATSSAWYYDVSARRLIVKAVP